MILKNIGSYIAQLLSKNEIAYIPGIGSFSPTYTGARYDAQQNAFVPPVLAIRFEPSSQHTQEVSPDLQTDINTLHETLDQGEDVFIEGIGTLQRKKSGIRFLPLRDNFYALRPISERADMLEIATPAPTVEPSVTESEVEHTHPMEVEETPEEALPTSSNTAWLKWVILLLLIGGGGYAYYLYTSNKAPNQVRTQISADTQDADSTLASPNASNSGQDTLSMADQNQALPEPIHTAPSAGNFEVIIASFRKLDEAEAYINTMRVKGYELRLIQPNRAGNLNKISYGAYGTKEEALNVLRQVRKDLVSGAWLLEKINN